MDANKVSNLFGNLPIDWELKEIVLSLTLRLESNCSGFVEVLAPHLS